MGTICSYADIQESINAGAYIETFFHKGTNGGGTGSRSSDWSMASGQPKYNTYFGSPYNFTPLIGAGNNSIYCGEVPPDGKRKFLIGFTLMNTGATPAQMMLLDYIGHYPFIDGDDIEGTNMTNISPLPRYADGKGLKMILICTNPTASGGSVTINYTDENDVSRMTTAGIASSQGVARCSASITTSGANNVAYYVPMAQGSNGVKRVDSIVFPTATSGFYTLLIAKPLKHLNVYESNTPVEWSFNREQFGFPRIYDGAFLNFMITGTSNSATAKGMFRFVWET